MEFFSIAGKTPAASVIVPVYNGEAYLDVALRSILTQTFPDFELIVHDDASTDRTSEIIRAHGDPRIVLVRTENREGISAGLNRCISMARSDLVFRMDADDIALPRRLERQVAFMQANPEVGVCGSWYESFSETGTGKVVHTAETHDHLRFITLFQTPFGHPTVVLRKSEPLKHGQFYGTRRITEDYDLWSRLVDRTRFANLQEVLLRYRSNPAGGTLSRQPMIMAAVHEIQLEQLGRLLPGLSESDRRAYLQLLFRSFEATETYAAHIHGLISRLLDVNRTGRHYPAEYFDAFFLERWQTVVQAMEKAGRAAAVRDLALTRAAAPAAAPAPAPAPAPAVAPSGLS